VGDNEYEALVRKAEGAGLDKYSALAYRDSQEASFPDTNNSSYNSSIVRIDTVSSQSQYVNWANAKLLVPMTLVSSCPSSVPAASEPAGITAQDYSSATQICFKPQGGLALISGIKVSLASGAVLLNEQGSNWYHAALRTLTAHDASWWEGEGAEILAALPSGSSSQTAGSAQIFYSAAASAGTATAGPYATYPSTAVLDPTSLNHGQDAGFSKRVAYFQRNAIATGGTPAAKQISFTVEIPLHLMHELFERMSFPVLGIRLQMEFTLAPRIFSFGSISTYASATSPTSLNDNYAAFQVGTGVPPPVCFIGAPNFNACYMVYDKIELSPLVQETVGRLMNSREGLIREVAYEGSDNNQLIQGVGSNNTVMPTNISQGSQNVKAFVAFLLPRDSNNVSIASYNIPTPVLLDNSFAITSSEVLVNNQNLYSSPFTYVSRYWNEYQKSFPIDAEGHAISKINYFDYQSGVGTVLYYDLSHVSSNLVNKNQPITIFWKTTRTAGAAVVDVFPLVIVNRAFNLSLSNATSATSVGLPQ